VERRRGLLISEIGTTAELEEAADVRRCPGPGYKVDKQSVTIDTMVETKSVCEFATVSKQTPGERGAIKLSTTFFFILLIFFFVESKKKKKKKGKEESLDQTIRNV
jgi:hypothetical protein